MLSTVLSGHVSLPELIALLLSSLFVIFVTMPVHEFFHAFAAYKLGDNTAKYSGRLTLNPLAHIDILGAVLIILVGFGFAKPVPVNQYNFKNPKRDMAIVGLAGPLSNFVLAFILFIISTIFGYFNQVFLYLFFFYAGYINIVLASFNLIPLPPMDGSRVLFAVLPDRIYYKIQAYERQIYYIVLALALFGFLDGVTGVISGVLLNICEFIINGIFKLFI